MKPRNTRKSSEICSVLKMKTPKRCNRHRSDVFIGNSEYFSHLFVFLLLSLRRYMSAGK